MITSIARRHTAQNGTLSRVNTMQSASHAEAFLAIVARVVVVDAHGTRRGAQLSFGS
jgi:hypothetical protein